MANKITYCKPNGEWGIDGVDMAALPPKVYSALCRLKDLEWPFGCDPVYTVDNDGKMRRYIEPYCTIDVENEADFERLKAAMAYYKEHVIDKEVQV